MKFSTAIFKTFFLSLCLIATVSFSYAQTASILPPAKTTFVDQNGKPLTSGTVDFYVPGTTTRKTTWQDSTQTVLNTNPIVLDAAGRAQIWGSGAYRQIVKDRNGNIIWDQVTSSAGSNSDSGGSVGSDGNAVGTILPWAGSVAPAQYEFAYGQTKTRTGYPDLLAALTQTQSATCVGGNTTITGLTDTTSIKIGAAIEGICLSAGTTVVSKTSSTLTLNQVAIISTTTNVTIFNWGNGDGSLTFNIPDLRGVTLVGRVNMGGAAASNLTTAFYGSDPSGIGAIGGSQSKVLVTANLPPYTPSGTNSTSSVSGTSAYGQAFAFTPGGAALVFVPTISGGGANAAVANVTGTAAAQTFVGIAQGGTSTAFSIVQPSSITNYIIKVTPNLALSVASIGQLTPGAPNQLAGTDGSGIWGNITVPTGLSVSSSALNFDIPSLTSKTVLTPGADYTYIYDGSTGTTKKAPVSAFQNLTPAYIAPVRLATTAALSNTPTYSNGVSGVGATLTAGSVGVLTVDGVATVLNDRILVKDQASAFQNGVYQVTTQGTAGVAYVLTRVTDFDTSAEMIANTSMLATAGGTNTGRTFTLQSTVTTVGTTLATFIQIGVSTVTSVNGQIGAVVSWYQPQGRLTLTSGLPVMNTSVAAATTVYYTPYVGNMMPIYDGANMVPTAFSEVSQATTDSTKSPAPVAINSVYDIFCWVDSGVNRCTRGPAWTNSTTRSAGTALVRVNGVLLNSVSITNGPAAQRGTYVGTIASDSASTINYVYGANGTAANFAVWNMYNRRKIISSSAENTAAWTYTSNTPRPPNGGTASRATFVSGLAEDAIEASYQSKIVLSGASSNAGVGIAMDSTTVGDKTDLFLATAPYQSPVNVRHGWPPQLGQHFIQALEFSDGVNTNTFTGQAQAALVFSWEN